MILCQFIFVPQQPRFGLPTLAIICNLPSHVLSKVVIEKVISLYLQGFAFINYASFEASDAAIEAMNGQYLCNRAISIS